MATNLREISTTPPEGATKAKARKQAKTHASIIGDLSEQFGAVGSHAMLIVFQGMDASGKDGAVRAGFSRSSPANIDVTSFKKPTDREMAHDFLWRIHPHTPGKGEIAVWNRSHYEDVLIQRVHGWIDEDTVDARFEAINAFERNLQRDNNTIILKFLLHTSKDEQEEQLRERLEEYDKHYKHNDGDWAERKHWDKYMDAYNDVLKRSEIPWIIVPTDKRWWRDFVVSKEIMDAFNALKMKWPKLGDDVNLEAYKADA